MAPIVPLLFFGGLVSLILLLLGLKLYFAYTKGAFTSDADLTGKLFVITGGNIGIGKEYVRDIASRNATIIMACRNVQRGEECAREIGKETMNQKIFVEKCDLSSLQSVRACCNRITKREDVPRIDYLVVFAAAVGDNTAKEKLTEENGLEVQFQCNYLSHFLMLHLLIDLLKRSDHARVILTCSAAHLLGKLDLNNIARLDKYDRQPYMTYGDSKLALVAMGRELADRLGQTAITVNSFSPGTVLTNGIKHTPYWHVKIFLTIVAFVNGKSVKDGAQTMLYLTLSEEVQGISGQYFADCVRAPHSRLVDDRKLRQDLWQLSMELVKPYLGPVDPLLE